MAGVESNPCKLQLQTFGQEMGLCPLHARGKLFPQLSSGLVGGCDSWEAAGVLQRCAEQMENEVLGLKWAALYIRLLPYFLSIWQKSSLTTGPSAWTLV